MTLGFSVLEARPGDLEPVRELLVATWHDTYDALLGRALTALRAHSTPRSSASPFSLPIAGYPAWAPRFKSSRMSCP